MIILRMKTIQRITPMIILRMKTIRRDVRTGIKSSVLNIATCAVIELFQICVGRLVDFVRETLIVRTKIKSNVLNIRIIAVITRLQICVRRLVDFVELSRGEVLSQILEGLTTMVTAIWIVLMITGKNTVNII